MTPFPQSYRVFAESASGIDATWTTEGPAKQTLTAAIPPDFDGPGGGFSPEELYALALSNCFVATFKVVAEKSRLNYDRIEAQGELVVDLGKDKRPWMTRLELSVTLHGVDDQEKGERILDKASHSCLILNSVMTEKVLRFQFA